MEHLYNLSGEKLYKKAIEFKLLENYDNYIIYMTMAANYEYQAAIDIIYIDKSYEKQDYANTLNFYLETSIDQNLIKNSYSIHFLAFMYRNGLAVEQDNQKAKKLYKRSCKKECQYSFNNLGAMYLYGHGITKNFKKAKILFELAIQKGFLQANGHLACMYQYGLGINIDYYKAAELYKLITEIDPNTFIDHLVDTYKNPCFKNNKNEIISYFNKINRVDLLNNLYGFDEYVISLIRDNYQLSKENKELKTHIEASPDGKLYLEAKIEWQKLKQK